jgi:hypothetical protein
MRNAELSAKLTITSATRRKETTEVIPIGSPTFKAEN